MEVSGKRNEDTASGKDSGLFCKSCSEEGQKIEAEGFCQNCQEYFCDDCCKHHRKLTVTKHHVVLDKQHMPYIREANQPVTTCTVKCKQHPMEMVKFYCEEHDTVGCGDCIIFGHKQCKIKHIYEVAKEFTNSRDYKELISTVEQVQMEISNKRDILGKMTSVAEDSFKKAVREIQMFRQKMNGYLDKAEQELLKKCEERKRENEETVRDHEKHLMVVKQELDDMKATLELKESNVADLFVEAKRIIVSLKAVDGSLRRPEPTIQNINFLKNLELEKNAVQYDVIGTLSFDTLSNFTEENPVLGVQDDILTTLSSDERSSIDYLCPVLAVESFKVSSNNDKTICFISSMILTSSDNILCADYHNNSVKVISVKTKKISCAVSLSSGPWDITMLEKKNQYATTLPEKKKIQLFRFSRRRLSKQGCISTEGECRGIAYHDKKLIVTFVDPPKLQVVSLHGNVILTVDNKNIFDRPNYVTVDQKKATMFVSDYNKHSVIKINMDGNIIATYEYNDFKNPRKLVLCENGSLLVCGVEENSRGCINHILENGENVIELLDDKDCNPQSLCYNEQTNCMHIWNWDSYKIHIYFTLHYIQTDGSDSNLTDNDDFS